MDARTQESGQVERLQPSSSSTRRVQIQKYVDDRIYYGNETAPRRPTAHIPGSGPGVFVASSAGARPSENSRAESPRRSARLESDPQRAEWTTAAAPAPSGSRPTDAQTGRPSALAQEKHARDASDFRTPAAKRINERSTPRTTEQEAAAGSSIESSSSTSRSHHLPVSAGKLRVGSDDDERGDSPDNLSDMSGLDDLTEEDKRAWEQDEYDYGRRGRGAQPSAAQVPREPAARTERRLPREPAYP